MSVSQTIDEKIRKGNTNWEVNTDYTTDILSKEFRKKTTMSFYTAWLISVFGFFILWVIFEMYYKYHVDFSKMLTTKFYTDAYHSMVPCSSNFEIFLFFAVFILMYYFTVTTVYNIFDLLLTPFWLKKNRKKRKQWRGEVLSIMYRIPLYIPKWILTFWVGMLFGMFGFDNPMTKEGRKELSKISAPSSYSSNNNSCTSASTSSRESNASEKFMEEYIGYRTSNGAYPIQSTHGLTQEEITMAIANADAYLDSLGYKK